MNGRKSYILISYKGKDITEKIKDYVEGAFTFNDNASGNSDTIQMTLDNKDKRWMQEWMPSGGDQIIVSIITKNWTQLNKTTKYVCGCFFVDSLSYSGSPRTARIGAISTPKNNDFDSKTRSKTWKKVTVKQIAGEVAKKAGMKLYYNAPNIMIQELEQNNATDCSFLYSLAKTYGLAMKAYYNRILIYEEEKFENRDPVCKLNESEFFPGYNLKINVGKKYTGAEMKYTPKKGKTIKVSVGKKGRMLSVSGKADSIADAQLKAKAALKEKNKGYITLTCTIMANPKIKAGCCIHVTGLGKLSGIYYADSVKHSVGKRYTMALELRYIKAVAEKQASANLKKSASGSQGYTVQKNDSLYTIAKKLYGVGAKYKLIYDANKEIIDAEAKKHGKTGGGHWIWPGMNLIIPEE